MQPIHSNINSSVLYMQGDAVEALMSADFEAVAKDVGVKPADLVKSFAKDPALAQVVVTHSLLASLG